ncbi:subclass B1 metallo-beta-lactamase [Reichenbachiella agarivorans]|uniref:beta-lactamase n=1 Tax=Reichenbachiella agarivorans TaxID=2979464 RepID=A0ABY6CPT1_9BACT|nr:subclass B1 metallo-beta-lactamase [Reichenbachiella agarivorans]UXP32502.1 subclass B1 metallo-beta-lactamase [Reichenbachiella agarivorans]
MRISMYCLVIGIYLASCGPKVIHESDQLKISTLTDNTLVHVSYLETESFGKVACNGLVYIHDGEAIVFDTPTTDSATMELINWLQIKSGLKITGLVVSHFHEDCLGGIDRFHLSNISTYSTFKTIYKAIEAGYTAPANGFDNNITLQLGDKEIISEFIGEGHTTDNIVSYIPAERVLFGGCLVKELNAGEGYVDDGNVSAWSQTVQAIKEKYPEAKHIVPGHGQAGGPELLDYTIELFSKYQK